MIPRVIPKSRMILRRQSSTSRTIGQIPAIARTHSHPKSCFQRNFSLSSIQANRPQYIRFGESPESSYRGTRGARWNRPTTLGAILVVASGVWYLAHLDQVPETGRWRYMAVSPALETHFGEKSELKFPELPIDHPVTIHVHRVVDRLLEANELGTIKRTLVARGAHRHRFFWDVLDRKDRYSEARMDKGEWNIKVIPSKFVNAAARPGTILVFTGILSVCKDENGLAAVLAHEIGHVVARHSAEKLSTAILFLPLLSVISFVFGSDWGDHIYEYALNRPNSWKYEKEADIIGLRMMSRACFNPSAAPAMFRRLAELEKVHGKGSSTDFFSTHPDPEARAQAMEDMLPKAYRIRQEANCADLGNELKRFERIL